MRRAGIELLQHASDLRELLHEVALRVEATGGVDDDDVLASALAGLERVVGHGRGVGAGVAGNDVEFEALRPGLELLDGGGAEGVAGGDEHGLALPLERPGELRGRGRFARAVDADHHDHGGRAVGAFLERGLTGAAAEHAGEHGGADLGRALALELRVLAVGLLDLLQDLVGRLDAEVGGDERLLELVERRGVDLAPAEERTRLAGDGRDGLREAVLKFFEESEHELSHETHEMTRKPSPPFSFAPFRVFRGLPNQMTLRASRPSWSFSRSRMPLMKRFASALENCFERSIASLIETTGGMSLRWIIS